MFISERANTWDTKQILQILFLNNLNKFFLFLEFVYLNVYSIACEYLFEEIYAWVRVHFPEFDKVFWLKTQQVYFIYSIPRCLKLGKSLQTSWVNFFALWNLK